MNGLTVIKLAGTGAIAAAAAASAFALANRRAASRPLLGPRGAVRQQVLAGGGFFARLEPLVRFIAARLRMVPLTAVRTRLDRRLRDAGNWLGLDADEFLALSLVSAALVASGALTLKWWLGMSTVFVVLGFGLGAMLPSIELDAARAGRLRDINRGLPSAIDLAAMCVGAGLDFPSSLRQVLATSSTNDGPLREEVERILQELALGRSRRAALEGFADRAPTEAVVDFVGAVVQAEQKGTPLVEVLRIQSGVLRMRRTVLAEEAAARAGVLMMLPLLMIFACVFLILLGPFIVNLVEGGF